MSLDYDLTKITNRDSSDAGWRITEAIIWGCMVTDIGTITYANYEEWYARYKIIWPGGMITMRNVYDHVGLVTNVPNATRNQWCKGILDRHMRLSIQDARREMITN